MEIRTERIERPTSDELVSALLAVRRAADAARDPDDPPIGPAELVPHLFVARPLQSRSVWLARRGDDPVGIGVAGASNEGANTHYSEVELDVVQGDDAATTEVHRALLRAAVPRLIGEGARTVAWWPDDDVARGSAAAAGLTFRQQERCSRLRTADLDDALLDEWTDAASARAAGYRLEQWTGRCPDHLLQAYADAYSGMNDAPLDEIEFTPERYTPQIVRRSEEVAAACGRTIVASLVVAPDGTGAGMTRIDVHPERPQIAHQEDTAVVAAHRGRRLGRWLKAANLRLARQAAPQIAVVQTYNAESNPWMLDINVSMGFRPYRAFDAYQGSLDAVRAAVA